MHKPIILPCFATAVQCRRGPGRSSRRDVRISPPRLVKTMMQDPIFQAFATRARRRPDAPLVVSPGRTATAGEVNDLARTAGEVLEQRSFAPGEVVALAAGNGPGMLASLLALLQAGLPALRLDARAPEPKGLRIARALGPAPLLRCRCAWPRGGAEWSLVETAADSPGGPLRLPGTAVVKLTSGSTGLPRGVAAPSAALLADDAALAASMGLRDDDRLLSFIPMSHSYGLSSLVLPALVRGNVLVVPEGTSLLEPFLAANRAGATVFPTVPAYLQSLLRLSHPPAWPPTLRLVISAGAPLSPATARLFRSTFGQPAHVFYGASECGGICYDREGGAGERGTVGTPVEGGAIELLPACAPTAGTAAPNGGGIVSVASAAVAQGYVPLGDPRLSSGRFTGCDLAEWRGGELTLRGRLDDLINVKGKKVDPREVEVVLGQLAGVDEVVVLGVPVPQQEAEMVRAVIACRSGRLTSEEVLLWCRAHLS